MRYFTAESEHGDEYNYGFCNDTIVRMFRSKLKRDEYVENSKKLSVEAIKRKDVTRYARNMSLSQNKMIEPKPFTGEFWGIVSDKYEISDGIVEVCDNNENIIEKLN